MHGRCNVALLWETFHWGIYLIVFLMLVFHIPATMSVEMIKRNYDTVHQEQNGCKEDNAK